MGSYSNLQKLSIAYDDDNSVGYNFKITKKLVAGRTYNVTLIQSFTNVTITKN